MQYPTFPLSVLKTLSLVGILALLGVSDPSAIAVMPSQPKLIALASISDWQFDPLTSQLEFTLPEGISPQYSLLEKLTRIVIRIPNLQVSTDSTQLYENGAIRSISLTQSQPEEAKIEINFAPEITLTREQVQLQRQGTNNRWVVRPQLKPPTPTPNNIATQPSPEPSLAPTPQVTPAPSPQVTPPQTFTPPTVTIPTPTPAVARVPAYPSYALPPTTPPVVTVPASPPTRSIGATVPPPPSTTMQTFAPPSRQVPFATPGQIIAFGEPLPNQGGETNGIQALPGNILLPAGTTLTMVYPLENPLKLEPKPDRQDVLLLQGGIMDSNGAMLIPPNTPVIGEFVTSQEGSRFIARAFYVNGTSIPLAAESQPIKGAAKPSQGALIRNTSIGGIALLLLTGFSGIGLLAGAAAGAATTFVTAPHPGTIQPGTVLEVRLTQDLPRFLY